MTRLGSSLLVATISLGLSIGVSCIAMNLYYAPRFHELVTRVRWPVGSYRFNERTENFELTPGFSGELYNRQFFLRTHELGFRIPRDGNASAVNPGGILSVGGSFTFGDEVEAEETFTHVAGGILSMPGYNYGVPSYSYASSILQLQDLRDRGVLDLLKPAWVVLGAGNWLVERSKKPFYPTADIQLAYPYLRKVDGEVRILKPLDFISVRHAIGFASSRPYYEPGTRQVELNLRRRLLLADLIPRVLYAKLQRRFFRQNLNHRDVYNFVVPVISSVVNEIDAKLMILHMPGGLTDLGNSGLAKITEECECAAFVSGREALTRFGALDAKLGHPDSVAHRAYGQAIAEAMRRTMLEDDVGIVNGASLGRHGASPD